VPRTRTALRPASVLVALALPIIGPHVGYVLVRWASLRAVGAYADGAPGVGAGGLLVVHTLVRRVPLGTIASVARRP
jgi:hypothetical protein